MVGIKVDTVRGVLSELGFKGKMLSDLCDLIVDEETLYTFYKFVLRNDEEEGRVTSLLLVHKFKKFMHDKQSFADYHEFIEAYNSVHEVFEKKKVLERLFRSESNDLIKIIPWLNLEMISYKKLYQLIVRYRSQYSVRDSLFLIETLHM
ncbi:hypothetical protein [Paenibacillus illinoisensis]|uniref:hypothetical protein n=1 Tax=Paenibacillus illinoisensis TaxID=59845 RepID=UPI00203F719B|nr:hypothetical protein [Paenibacillus illinoisensis]MCM3202894.1 hypothetical protein [Paenibacillus illinoisensis]